MRGQYPQNTRIWANIPPEGGYERFHELGREDSTVATCLNAAGYDTALMGKYFNLLDTTEVPPGWDTFHAWYERLGEDGKLIKEEGSLNVMNSNGTLVNKGDDTYQTDLIAEMGVEHIEEGHSNPFFLYLAPQAIHQTTEPPERYADAYPGLKAPRTPPYDEKNVSEKPRYIRDREPLSARQVEKIDEHYRARAATLLSLEDLVEDVIDALRDSGELDNTYIVLTSDNGFHMGEHRLVVGKMLPYETDIRVPLVVRGPGVPEGTTDKHLVANNDLAPTFAELADADAPSFVDGRSLLPLLTQSNPPAQPWRTALLIEDRRTVDEASSPLRTPAWHEIRTHRYAYIEYGTGEKELYDLYEDPHQRWSLDEDRSRAKLISDLSERLARLKTCKGDTCHAAEGG